jgi:hypothetical protein
MNEKTRSLVMGGTDAINEGMYGTYGENKHGSGVGIKRKVLLTGAEGMTAMLIPVSTGEESDHFKSYGLEGHLTNDPKHVHSPIPAKRAQCLTLDIPVSSKLPPSIHALKD